MEGTSRKRTKTIANKKKSSRRHRSPTPDLSPLLPDHWEVEFMDHAHRTRFEGLLERQFMAQKFAHIDSLRELSILNEVQTLFQNIGWDNMLNLNAPSYARPSREILSSLAFENNVLSFRLANRSLSIHVDQIAELVGQDTAGTFDPYAFRARRADNDVLRRGWSAITSNQVYHPSSAKASSIIHPVLKVAHRILASVVFPREELSTVTAMELKILLAMISSTPQRPHFGHCVVNRLQRLARVNAGQFFGGGLLTLIVESPFIGLEFSPDEPILPGGHFLTTSVLETMHLFRRSYSNFIWSIPSALNAAELRIGHHNAHLLQLDPDNLSLTDWLLHDILHPDQPAPTFVPPSTHEAGPSTTHHEEDDDPSSVDGRLSRIEDTLSGLRTDYHSLHTTVRSIDTRLTTFHTEYTQNWGQQQQHWEQQRQYWENQQKQYSDMYSMFQACLKEVFNVSKVGLIRPGQKFYTFPTVEMNIWSGLELWRWNVEIGTKLRWLGALERIFGAEQWSINGAFEAWKRGIEVGVISEPKK
ncbi:hypothetical protein L2E82_48153 [Cichorium intybus]|uniref:Uncharacterized protein n=1 Tax=Cichorium intybus TaxID=13427 RepID=A0ACB8YXP9_CICIN|nr:hypothetical protein L2E82_48153 [Cichorium intybus]